MSFDGEIKENCAFHIHNESTEKCAECKLAICDLDQDYNMKQERICPICANRHNAKKTLRLFNYGLYAIIIVASVVLIALRFPISYLFIPLLLLMVAPYVFRPYLLKLYFKGLEPQQVVIPVLKYFEISGNPQYYSLFLKNIKAIPEEELTKHKEIIMKHTIPAIAFNFSKLDDKWENELSEVLRIDKSEFRKDLTTKYRKILIQTALHGSQPNISKFMFFVAEETKDDDFLKEYIQEICSDEIAKLSDKELNTIYKDLLEELYLFEEQFYEVCDRLNLSKEKEKIKNLVKRFVPPPVPKNQIEALLPPEQLEQKRQMEEKQIDMIEEDEEVQIEEVLFEEEKEE
ncbi:MAG: hypothetical protein ACTSWZ_06930 [Candidatus Heimdallarchaeaceae archaeon]